MLTLLRAVTSQPNLQRLLVPQLTKILPLATKILPQLTKFLPRRLTPSKKKHRLLHPKQNRLPLHHPLNTT
jgi:hypothetical protein